MSFARAELSLYTSALSEMGGDLLRGEPGVALESKSETAKQSTKHFILSCSMLQKSCKNFDRLQTHENCMTC